MKISTSFPNPSTINTFLEKQNKDIFSYPEVKQTIHPQKVAGYDNDNNQVCLGRGEAVWESAKTALSNWQHFPQPWTKVIADDSPPKVGQTVAVLFKVLGVWWFNSARVVYTFDEPHRFGFAYGTLRAHIECGEECFWLEKDKDGNVTYHIKAFSRPNWWAVKLAYPFARWYQRKFVRNSFEQMKKMMGSE